LKHRKVSSKIVIAKMMDDYKIPTKNSTGNTKFCNISDSDLLILFNKNHWIHETDEFVDDKTDENELDANTEQKETEEQIYERLKKKFEKPKEKTLDEKINEMNEFIKKWDKQNEKAKAKAVKQYNEITDVYQETRRNIPCLFDEEEEEKSIFQLTGLGKLISEVKKSMNKQPEKKTIKPTREIKMDMNKFSQSVLLDF
jgi:ATP-dependent DNA ligase